MRFELHPRGWQSTSRGYRFKGSPPSLCKSVVLGQGRLTAACRGDFAFSLDESQQGQLDVEFVAGAGVRYCMHFGGAVEKDYGMGFGRKGKGRFLAVRAPAPGDCPAP